MAGPGSNSSSVGDWTKILSITGKPGTGKTNCLHACIQYLLDKTFKCLVVTPTGYLASSYRALFDDDIDANTVHSSFSIPIDNSQPQVNWALATYDVIIIDEVSMVPLAIFTHIMSTLQQLPTRPVLVISGDKYKLPPIITQGNAITSTNSIYNFPSFHTISNSYNLTRQYRCIDEQYSEILNHLRCSQPTPEILRLLQQDRLLHHSDAITDTQLLAIVQENASATFLTVSRKAVLRINNIILDNMFPANLSVATVDMDNDDRPRDIYTGMRVIITQNRDKNNGVVNGQPAIVVMAEGMTIILQLPNGKKVSVYPVSTKTQFDRIRTCYPFVPGYAMTICKSQGQTLQSVVVWFDTSALGPGAAYVALSRVKNYRTSIF